MTKRTINFYVFVGIYNREHCFIF